LAVTGSGTISGTLSDGTAFSGTAPVINLNVTPTATTTYTISTLTDADCAAIASDMSGSAIITVNEPVVITTQPAASQTVCSSFPVSFSVVATGTGLTYQWRKGTTNIPGATSSTYTINSVSLTDAASNYNVVVSGASPCASVTSANAELIVNQGMDITGQPINQTICEGQNVTFSVTATGSISEYLWRKNGIPVSGGNYSGINSSTLTISGVSSADAGNYDVVISSTGGTCDQVISNPASLAVNTRPTAAISGTQAICNGNAATLSIAVTGTGIISGTLSDGTVFSGTSPTITINVSPTSTTTYTISSLSDVNCAAIPADMTGNATVTVTPMPTAAISYAGSPFCTSIAGTQPVTFTGTTGGIYSSTAGLTLNAATGEITPGTSTPGTYTVTYTITAAGGCDEVTATATVTITLMPTATISYTGSPYCTG
jgi:hypothetical protein